MQPAGFSKWGDGMPHQDGLFFRVLRRCNMVLLTIVLLTALFLMGRSVTFAPMLQFVMTKLHLAPPPAVKTTKIAARFDNQADWYPTENLYPPVQRDKVLYVLRKTIPPEPAAAGELALTPTYEDLNVMIIDEKTGEGRWLFPGRNQRIISRDAIYEGSPPPGAVVGTDPRPIIALVIHVVEDDTNNDGKLTSADEVTLYLWRKDKPELVKLLSSEGGAGGGLAGPDRYVVNYGKGDKSRVAAYSVPDFKLIYDKELPDAPH